MYIKKQPTMVESDDLSTHDNNYDPYDALENRKQTIILPGESNR
jgi:hypothetical protein